MNRYRAMFLDRDGVLCRASKSRHGALSRAFADLLGADQPRVGWNSCMVAFENIFGKPPFERVTSLDREHAFWRAVYQEVLRSSGATGDLEQAASRLYEEHPFYRLLEPYEETVTALEALRQCGHRLGVISDTFPSLELTLREAGIAAYFESFTASSLVGAGKPDPRIFRAATASLGV
jgi:putative hydrolase of the HAD superfamily